MNFNIYKLYTSSLKVEEVQRRGQSLESGSVQKTIILLSCTLSQTVKAKEVEPCFKGHNFTSRGALQKIMMF